MTPIVAEGAVNQMSAGWSDHDLQRLQAEGARCVASASITDYRPDSSRLVKENEQAEVEATLGFFTDANCINCATCILQQ